MSFRPLVRRAALAMAAPALALAAAASPAHALRVTTWNLLDYQETTLAGRQPNFLAVMQSLDTDVLIAQELITPQGADSFLAVLRTARPGRVWKGGSSTFILAAQSALYYDSLAVSISNLTSIADGGPRQVLVALVKPLGYRSAAASFRLYSMHLKAGNTTTDSTTRRTECTNLRNTLNAAPAGTNLLVGGDTNFYGDWEGGYIRLTEHQLDDDGRLFDPLALPGTWNNPAYAPYHTQCPCLTGCQPSFSGGGLDDRFDLILRSASLGDGQGLDVVSGGLPGGYGAYGNDGAHYNDDINGGGVNFAVGLAVANALHDASDHIPVVATLQLPARLAAPSALAFGDAIVGATPTQALAVDDAPPPPAAALTYSLSAPAGFSAPGGPFTNAAADPPATHTIGMDATSVGAKSGTLTITSNDLDTTAKAVQLSGRVLAHAVPSLDSASVVTSTLVDLGTHPAGGFADTSVRVHDQGFGTLEAPLALASATFSGGAGRFSIVGGFSPSTISDVGRTLAIRFSEAGATPDSTYEGTLTITSTDAPLPGASARPDLVVSLRARLTTGTGAVGGGAPALRFEPPAPNPLRDGTTLAFTLPASAPVSLAVFDAHGRRVATLAEGPLDAGRHELRWSARDDAGRPVGAGLYFVRFATPGLTRLARVAVIR